MYLLLGINRIKHMERNCNYIRSYNLEYSDENFESWGDLIFPAIKKWKDRGGKRWWWYGTAYLQVYHLNWVKPDLEKYNYTFCKLIPKMMEEWNLTYDEVLDYSFIASSSIKSE